MKRCLRCQTTFVTPGWACPACAYSPQVAAGIAIHAPELKDGGAGFRPEAFAQLAAVEARNFWFRARNRLIIWALGRALPEVERYLEIGCGTGFVLAAIASAYPRASLVGSEVFSAGLPFAASRVPRAELIQMDAREIPYADEFDLVGAFDVLEHIVEDEAVLSAMHRALHPGGRIAITVPQHRWLWSAADESACHVRRYEAAELREKVTRAGFVVSFETSFVSLLLPAMVTARLFKPKAATAEETMSELDLPPLLNRIFLAIMTLERLLIRAGVRFGFGGSRVLIARKPG